MCRADLGGGQNVTPDVSALETVAESASTLFLFSQIIHLDLSGF